MTKDERVEQLETELRELVTSGADIIAKVICDLTRDPTERDRRATLLSFQADKARAEGNASKADMIERAVQMFERA